MSETPITQYTIELYVETYWHSIHSCCPLTFLKNSQTSLAPLLVAVRGWGWDGCYEVLHMEVVHVNVNES